MPRWNRAAISALLVFGVMSTAACSTGSGSGDSAETTLNIPGWFWADPSQSAYFDWVLEEHAAAYPDVKVNAAEVAEANYSTTVLNDINAGNAPDLVLTFDADSAAWTDQGLLAPLDDYLAEANIDVADLLPTMKLVQRDGVTYGVQFLSNPRTLFYNQLLLDEVGAEVPTDTEGLINVAEAFKAADTSDFGFAIGNTTGDVGETFQDLQPVVYGFGGGWVRDGEVVANSPETVAALEFLKKLYDDELIPRGQNEVIYSQAFVEGHLGSEITGPWAFGLFAGSDLRDDIVSTPLPFPAGKTASSNIFLAIPADSENKDAAWDLIKIILSPEGQSRIVSMQNSIPGNPSVVDDATAEAAKAWYPDFLAAASSSFSMIDGLGGLAPQVQEIVVQKYQAMLVNNVDPQETADAIQDELTKLFNSN